MATYRSRRLSKARWTVDMPPTPIRPSIRYLLAIVVVPVMCPF